MTAVASGTLRVQVVPNIQRLDNIEEPPPRSQFRPRSREANDVANAPAKVKDRAATSTVNATFSRGVAHVYH